MAALCSCYVTCVSNYRSLVKARCQTAPGARSGLDMLRTNARTFHGVGPVARFQPAYSRGSVILPRTALAATVSGLAK